jgi:hypothetical protein
MSRLMTGRHHGPRCDPSEHDHLEDQVRTAPPAALRNMTKVHRPTDQMAVRDQRWSVAGVIPRPAKASWSQRIRCVRCEIRRATTPNPMRNIQKMVGSAVIMSSTSSWNREPWAFAAIDRVFDLVVVPS